MDAKAEVRHRLLEAVIMPQWFWVERKTSKTSGTKELSLVPAVLLCSGKLEEWGNLRSSLVLVWQKDSQ